MRFISSANAIICGLSMVLPATCFAQRNPPSQGREVTKLYADNCASCHGADMSGGSASSLVDNSWQYGSDDASIARSIRDGHADRGMPAMRDKLNEAEIRALVVYIHERGAAARDASAKHNAPSPGAI